THLELQRYFGIKEILSPETARKIYDECNEKLRSPEFSVKNLLQMMKVTTLCTTDDPLDDLNFHQKIASEGFDIKVLPAFRPDKAMNSDDLPALNQYIDKLAAIDGASIADYESYKAALRKRHDYFAENGCTVSDHGLENICSEDYTPVEISDIFKKIRAS